MTKNEFLSPRWYGRFVGLLLKVALAKGIRFESEKEVTVANLLMKVMDSDDPAVKNVVYKLMQKWSDTKKIEDEQGVVISKELDESLQKKGQREANIVFRDWSISRLLEEVDLCAEEDARLAVEKKKRRKLTTVVLSCLSAVVLFIVIFNLPYFKELRYYHKVVDSYSVGMCRDYYEEYPVGRHYEDVLNHEVRISSSPIKPVTKYLHMFPGGKYENRMNLICDSLWDRQIAVYRQKDKSGIVPEAEEYMASMLQYMKQNRINTVRLKISPHINLKDYNEYDESVRMLLELFWEEEFPLEENMLSLKDNFTTEDRSVLIDILSEGVEDSFGRLFSSDFINVQEYSDADKISPVLSFEYFIGNRLEYDDEDGLEIPSIWTYYENNIPKNYILAIDVKFNVIFSIPASDVQYVYSEIGDPGSEISGILSISDGYRRMTQKCFAKFSNKMSMNLGLDPVYSLDII